MSVLKKAKYVGLISSLFCVGSLMATPSGFNQSSDQQKPSASSQDRSGGNRVGGSQGSSSIHPNTGMHSKEQGPNNRIIVGSDAKGNTTYSIASKNGPFTVTTTSDGNFEGLVFPGIGGRAMTVTPDSTNERTFNLTSSSSGGLTGHLNFISPNSATFIGNFREVGVEYQVTTTPTSVSFSDRKTGDVYWVTFPSDGTAVVTSGDSSKKVNLPGSSIDLITDLLSQAEPSGDNLDRVVAATLIMQAAEAVSIAGI